MAQSSRSFPFRRNHSSYQPMSLIGQRRHSHWNLRVLVSILLLLSLRYSIQRHSMIASPWSDDRIQTSFSQSFACRNLPGANDTVVILKTGSTELQDRMPIHMQTTLRCYPNLVLFSDHQEDFGAYHIHDALDSVSIGIKESHPDFELWRQLQRGEPFRD